MFRLTKTTPVTAPAVLAEIICEPRSYGIDLFYLKELIKDLYSPEDEKTYGINVYVWKTYMGGLMPSSSSSNYECLLQDIESCMPSRSIDCEVRKKLSDKLNKCFFL